MPGLADVFDAMTTDVYREGLPLDYALSPNCGGRGTQFDPALTEVFVRLIRSRGISAVNPSAAAGRTDSI